MLLVKIHLLPYVSLRYDVLHSPYVTKDILFIKRKRLASASCGKRFCATFVTSIVRFAIYFSNGMMMHLNKRGIPTNFFVINSEEEVKYICRSTGVNGVMTDRPEFVREILLQEKNRSGKKKVHDDYDDKYNKIL